MLPGLVAGAFMMNLKTGFTLIEFLLLAAVIGVLAAIAAPNFFEARVRSGVARTMHDMRATGVAMEAYIVDYKQTPLIDGSTGRPGPNVAQYVGWMMMKSQGHYVGKLLTTPVAYLSEIP